ncbi:SUMF1/EgtB/PvdO family nonheme iron enzyme [Rubritalea squalenifaciens]|nr:SUMF1/EgtB/PvdO family nonheme iron enzyme [Rubritalea squalenifaciens]
MVPEDQRLTPGMQIGDYLLEEIAFEGAATRTWVARQVSVNRPVIIDSLNREHQQDDDIVSEFLADVRAKARVDHPFIGSVYEAIREGRLCFFAREALSGETLEEMIESGQQLAPEHIAHILRQISEANLYLEKHNVASLPLESNQVYVSEGYLTRIVNMAVGGDRDHSISTQEKHLLGSALLELLEKDKPGSTRTKSLLSYMTDLERDIPITWEQIRDLSEGIERQLTTPDEPLALEQSTVKLRKNDTSKKLVLFTGIGIGAAALIIIASLFINRPDRPKERILNEAVEIPSGNYPTHDGGKNQLRSFWIDAHEVTIGEYAEFLALMDQLTPSQQENFQHEDQPESKESHKPDDWDNLLAAARKGMNWNGRKVTLNCPVVGVDWWDAYAFAEQAGRRLPTQEEWYAALSSSKTPLKEIKASPWGPVDQSDEDLTANKIHGMAGNVSEWTRKLAKNPAYPTKPKMVVLCGGSFLKPGSTATSREWLDPSTSDLTDPRDLRRPDLGFRTIGDTAPSE